MTQLDKKYITGEITHDQFFVGLLDRQEDRLAKMSNTVAVELSELQRIDLHQFEICDSCLNMKAMKELRDDSNMYGVFYTCIVACKSPTERAKEEFEVFGYSEAEMEASVQGDKL